MKLSDDYISYELDGENVLVCMDSKKFAGVLKLNRSAAFIVEQMKTETNDEKITSAMLEHFTEIDEGKAIKAIKTVTESLRSVGALEE